MVQLYYCELWLSFAKVLNRIFELKEGITIFLRDSNNSDEADLCCSEDFI